MVYALFVTLLAYRTLSWEAFSEATLGAVKTTAMVLLVIGCAAGFGWLLAFLKIPAELVVICQGLPVVSAGNARTDLRHLHQRVPETGAVGLLI